MKGAWDRDFIPVEKVPQTNGNVFATVPLSANKALFALREMMFVLQKNLSTRSERFLPKLPKYIPLLGQFSCDSAES